MSQPKIVPPPQQAFISSSYEWSMKSSETTCASLPSIYTSDKKAEVFDRLRGFVFGAALGNALGLATQDMSWNDVLKAYGKDPVALGDAEGRPFVPTAFNKQFTVGDWTHHMDQVVLVLQMLLDLQGSVVPGRFAHMMKDWSQHGVELSDVPPPAVIPRSISSVVNHPEFLETPRQVAKNLEMACPVQELGENGALLRSLLAGCFIFWNDDSVIRNSISLCEMTHTDRESCLSASLGALIVASLMKGEPFRLPNLEEICFGRLKHHFNGELSFFPSWMKAELPSKETSFPAAAGLPVFTSVPHANQFSRSVSSSSNNPNPGTNASIVTQPGFFMNKNLNGHIHSSTEKHSASFDKSKNNNNLTQPSQSQNGHHLGLPEDLPVSSPSRPSTSRHLSLPSNLEENAPSITLDFTYTKSSLGFRLSNSQGLYLVNRVFPTFNVCEFGVRHGDRLLGINGVDVSGLQYNDIIKEVKKPAPPHNLRVQVSRSRLGEEVDFDTSSRPGSADSDIPSRGMPHAVPELPQTRNISERLLIEFLNSLFPEIRDYGVGRRLQDYHLAESADRSTCHKALGAALYILAKYAPEVEATHRSSHLDQAVKEQNRIFQSALMEIVLEGGDACANATICGALMGSLIGFNGIPEAWLTGLNAFDSLFQLVDNLGPMLGVTDL